jgi:hypothetical protein
LSFGSYSSVKAALSILGEPILGDETSFPPTWIIETSSFDLTCRFFLF